MKIVVFGAGSIGCYVGGRLAATGEEVVFYGRERLKKIIDKHGLKLTHYDFESDFVASINLDYTTDPKCLNTADIILLTVKSQDTEKAIQEILQHAHTNAKIISLQNGVSNPKTLKLGLPDFETIGGMVPFNVVNNGEGHFHCGTEGHLVFAKTYESGLLAQKCKAANIPTKLTDNIDGVLWGKLLLNLNNALNLLSDKPLKEELADRNYRRVLAMCISEALTILDAAGIKPVQVGKSPPRLLPKILKLPNFAFETIAKGMLKIDPMARSSMWEDLQAQRSSEIDFINGEIIELAEKNGISAPINSAIVSLVKQAFEKGRSPGFNGYELLTRVTSSQ